MPTTPLRHRLSALAVALLALGGFAASYVVAVRTPAGQAWDTDLMRWFGGAVSASGWGELPAQLLGLVSPLAVLLGTVVVGLLALASSGLRTALAAVVTVVGTVLGAQVLKLVLERPELVEAGSNSFPSGHTAAVAGLAAGLVVALALHARALAWVAAVGVTAATGLATVALQWHRPSDVLASGLLAVAVAATTVGVVGRDRRRGSGPRGRVPADPRSLARAS